MKILVTLDFPPEKGGIQQYLHGIVRSEFGRADCVLVGCAAALRSFTDTLDARVERATFPGARANKKLCLLGLLPLYVKALIRARGSATVLCGNVYAALLPWLLGPVTKQKYHVYTYGTELLQLRSRGLKARILLRILRKAERRYALGVFTCRLLRQIGVGGDVEVVPPRINLPLQQESAHVAEEGVVRILSVGRLVEHKGHGVLVSAVDLLPESCNWRLVIIGNGPHRQEIEKRRLGTRHPERIAIRGELPDEEVRRCYREADVFVFPSLHTANGAEGFGIVLLEAMAYNVPVIASSTGGIIEVLDNGSCGLLVVPGNPQAIADALIRLHTEPSLAAKLTRRARRRLVENYVWKS